MRPQRRRTNFWTRPTWTITDRVRIVHGVGMGALKRAIADLLSGHPHVAKFYAGGAE